MPKYAQILWGKAHWIFESDETMEQLRQRFAPDMVFVDITNIDVEEGWDYDEVANTFAPPEPPVQTKDQLLTQLDTQYQPQFDALKLAWAAANLDGNTSLALELQTEYQALKQEYQTAREGIVNG